MNISKEKLSAEAQATGFRPEVLEKVIHLLLQWKALNVREYKGK